MTSVCANGFAVELLNAEHSMLSLDSATTTSQHIIGKDIAAGVGAFVFIFCTSWLEVAIQHAFGRDK